MFALKLIMFVVPLWILAVTSAECPTSCHCSKYKMFCIAAKLNALPSQVYNTTELVRVELDRITQVSTTTGLQNVTHLKLVRVQLQEIQPGAFCNMTRLEYLEITHNNITVLRANTFKCLQNVYLLNLTYNNIDTLERGTFAGLDNIRILDLSENLHIYVQANAFEGMRYVNNCNITLPEIHRFRYQRFKIESDVSKYLCTFTYLSLGEQLPRRNLTHLNPAMYLEFFKYVYKNTNLIVSGLFYLGNHGGYYPKSKYFLDLAQRRHIEYFHNLTQLRFFDYSQNSLRVVSGEDFKELTSLRTLDIRYNDISRLGYRCFHSLQSLEILDLSQNQISVIDSEVFVGLSKLRMLDLHYNEILRLENNTFSTLRKLRELNLEGNNIQHIDTAAFSHLKLAHLSLTFNASPLNTSKLTIFRNSDMKYYLEFYGLSLPQDIEITKTSELQLADASSFNTKRELGDALLAVRNITKLDLTLYLPHSTQFLESLPNYPNYELEISNSDFKFTKNTTKYLAKVKILTVENIEHISIGQAEFREMKSLIEFSLYYNTNLTLMNGSFEGLDNLKLLAIGRKYYTRENIPLKSLDAGVFLGLYNLTKLYVTNNRLAYLNPGTFQDLKKIEEIHLNDNDINKIDAGVFGALCVREFELSCKNVTLPEYCNSTDALTTLKYLDLSLNNIAHIHPHAFISCNNLHTLDLSHNTLLNLDYTFLYTPGLKVLDMELCGIKNIPNNTFECSPLLSDINFNFNKLNKVTVDTLFNIRHLQSIGLSNLGISCDCDLYQTWTWLRQHRVQYEFYFSNINSFCEGEDIDTAMINIKCNITANEMSSSKNKKTTIGDFAFFKQYVEPTVLIVIFTSGLVCNGFLLFVSLWHSDMRTQHNACVIHLATVDLLSLVLNLPLSYWDVVNVTWEFDDTLCKVFLFSKDVMVGVTVLSVVALSVERFLVARNFKDLKKICSKSEKPPIVWLLMMTWISAIVTSLPAYFSAKADYRCLYCPPGYKDYIRNVWTFQLVMYCLAPAVVIMFLNIKTSQFLRESVSKIPGELKHNVKARNRKTAANTVLVLVLLFVISNFPSYILRVLVAWSAVDMEDMFLVSFFTFCLFFFNTVFNPISLFIMSSKYKAYALRYISFLGKEKYS